MLVIITPSYHSGFWLFLNVPIKIRIVYTRLCVSQAAIHILLFPCTFMGHKEADVEGLCVF